MTAQPPSHPPESPRPLRSGKLTRAGGGVLPASLPLARADLAGGSLVKLSNRHLAYWLAWTIRIYAWLEGAIDILAMTDLDDVYDEFVVFDSVDDSILALADSIAVMARKLLASRGTGLVAELPDPFYDALAILFPWDGLDLLHGRGLD